MVIVYTHFRFLEIVYKKLYVDPSALLQFCFFLYAVFLFSFKKILWELLDFRVFSLK